MQKVRLITTNWQYKGLRIYRDIQNAFYIEYQGNIYPINFQELPKTIKYDESAPLKDYTVYGKIGQDQE